MSPSGPLGFALAGDGAMPIRLELVEQLITPNSAAMLLRARMRQARPLPLARVSVRCGRFVAEIDFEVPIGPEKQDGLALMLTVLPAPLRWTPARKAELLTAIRAGALTAEDALHAYSLSAEELESWAEHHDRAGHAGLTRHAIQEARG